MSHGWLGTFALLLVLVLPLGASAHEPLFDRPTTGTEQSATRPPLQGDRDDLLVESFEDEWPPAGWAIINLGGAYTWDQTAAEQHSGAKSAWVRYGTVGQGQDEYLVSPALDFSNLTTAFLDFFEMMQYWTGYGDHHSILVSTVSQTNPADFQTVVEWQPGNHEIPPIFGDDPVTVDLSAFVGEPVVYVAFRYQGTYADDWFIDDVKVYEPFAHDVAVIEVAPDDYQFEAPFSLLPQVVVENRGQNEELFDLELVISESGTPVYSEILTIPLAVTQRDTIDFPALGLNPGNYYSLDAQCLLLEDLRPDNDLGGALINTYTQPHVPLGFMITNSGSGPAAGAELFLDSYMATAGTSASVIRVHTPWPGWDGIYHANPDQNDVLIDVNSPGYVSVPRFLVDGVVDEGDNGPDYPGSLEDRKAVHSPAGVSMHWLEASEELVVRVDMVEPVLLTGDYRLRVAVAEDDVLFDGGNGHLYHQQAFRYMYPDTDGITVPAAQGIYTYMIPCPLDPGWDFEELRAVAYLRDDSNGRIWQAATGHLKDLYGTITITPAISQVYEGDSFTLDLEIDPTGLGIKGVEVEVDFNETSVRLDSITVGPWFTGNGEPYYFYDYMPDPPDSAGSIHFAASFLSEATSSAPGVLAVCHFTALSLGSSPLPYLIAKVRDLDNHELDYSTSDADVVYVLPINTGVEDEAPTALRLLGNVPNPFNPTTTIKYEIPDAGNWRVDIFDATGRQIRSLANAWQEPGRYDVRWDGRNDSGSTLGSGVYFAKVSGPTGSMSSKMLLLK